MNNTADRYTRNWLYISEEEQTLLKDARILLAGAGLGSVIAEGALRMGFENITIIDGDTVEDSNLNRQNYTELNIGKSKVESLKQRLLDINGNAKIDIEHTFLDTNNVHQFVKNYDIAINALDFNSDIPTVFDKACQDQGIYVLHPYNLGWGALVTIIKPDGLNLQDIITRKKLNELSIVEFFSFHERMWNNRQKWIEDLLEAFKYKKQHLPTPQLSIGAQMVSAMTIKLMYNIITDKPIKTLPQAYICKII